MASLRSRGGPLPWIPKTLAKLVGQALACMQKMQRSGVPEHFSAAMIGEHDARDDPEYLIDQPWSIGV